MFIPTEGKPRCGAIELYIRRKAKPPMILHRIAAVLFILKDNTTVRMIAIIIRRNSIKTPPIPMYEGYLLFKNKFFQLFVRIKRLC